MAAKLIGLCGKARSGKDTAADTLVQAYGFRKRAFAQPIYDMLQAGLGIHVPGRMSFPPECTRELPYRLYVLDIHKQDAIRPFNVSLRHLLQTLGTEWGRAHVGQDLWVQLMDIWYSQNHCHLVIPDVRFENEAAWVKSHGGRLIEVFRDEEDYSSFRTHISEALPFDDLIDHRINNSYSMKDLECAISGTVRDLFA